MTKPAASLKGAVELAPRAKARLLEDDEIDRMIAERDGTDDEEQTDDDS